ncbi:MAG: hypothetical protein HY904_18775 [Deltaproteobacteria bacterium]|nr:hypothetical protein [Deltaproteobacteria bacterium]
MPRVDANIRSLVQPMLQRGRIEKADVENLLGASVQDKVLTPTERAELKAVLEQNADKFAPDAKARLASFLAMKNVTLRNETVALEKDGVIDTADANKLLGLAQKDGKISSGEKYSLSAMLIGSKLSPEAKSIIATKIGAEGGGGTGAPTLDVNLPEVNGSKYTLSPDGHFQVGANTTPARYDAGGALAAYRAAQALSGAPADALKGVPVEVKTKMLAHLEKCFEAGQDTQALPQVARERMRSAAATSLLAVIQGCTTPAEKGVRDQAIAAYLKHAGSEPMNGLRASMYFNLEGLKASLSPEQAKGLEDVRKQVVPQAPPYATWFANNGERAINIKHYAHDECWQYGADPVANYTAMGFTVKEKNETAKPPTWKLEKVIQNAQGGPVTMCIEVKRTHDGLFESMDDPKTNVILYTGHSNLGGNVSEELRLGKEEKGNKLVVMGMCRGKQNIPEFANKYPNTQFITTDAPSYFSSMPTITRGMVEGLGVQANYTTIKDKTGYIMDEHGKDNYFFPHEDRRYQLYDVDQDGRVDAQGAGRDRLYDVGLKFPAGTKVDLVARDNDHKADELDGGKVLHAVQFLNTLATYHVDHGNNTSRFNNGDMDAFLGGGWFEGPKDEAVRVKKETLDGKTFFRVSVNKAYADQSQFALGTMVQYEVFKQLSQERSGGTLSKQDQARAILFAGEYLSYMYCSYEEAEGAMRSLSKRSGLGNFGFEAVYKAIETDGHGYVTDAQMNALLQKLGQAPTPP